MWPDPAAVPLPDREWHKHLEALLDTGMVNPEILEFLDYKQQYCLNEIKKTFARKEYRARKLMRLKDIV